MSSNTIFLRCPPELTLNKSYNDPDNMQALCGDIPPSDGMSSNSTYLICPQELTLNKSYNDPDNMEVLCGDMPPSSNGSTQGDSTQGDSTQGGSTQGDSTQGDSTQGSPPIQPNNICPNGQTAMGNSDGETNTCKPINCPSGYTPGNDSQGTIGCKDSVDNLYICASGESLQISPVDGSAYCGITPGANDTFRNGGMTINYGVCPTTNYAKNTKNACQYVNLTCPRSNTHGVGIPFFLMDVPGCSLFSGNMVVCPTGFKHSIDDSDMLTCTPITSYTGSDSGNCPAGFGSEADANNNPMCVYESTGTFRYGEGSAGQGNTEGSAGQGNTEEPSLFTNVNGFRSKKERKVENFSQKINNSKCKTRY
jgi:hypothetical protein